jgi:hypothetical protein
MLPDMTVYLHDISEYNLNITSYLLLFEFDDDRELEDENILLQVEHQKDLHHQQRRRRRYEIDMTGWDYDDDEDGEDVRFQEPSTHVQPAKPDSIDLAKEAPRFKNMFIDSYLKSIRPARDIIRDQWRECSCDKKNLDIEAHVNDDEVKSHFTSYLCTPFTLNIYKQLKPFVLRPKCRRSQR